LSARHVIRNRSISGVANFADFSKTIHCPVMILHQLTQNVINRGIYHHNFNYPSTPRKLGGAEAAVSQFYPSATSPLVILVYIVVYQNAYKLSLLSLLYYITYIFIATHLFVINKYKLLDIDITLCIILSL